MMGRQAWPASAFWKGPCPDSQDRLQIKLRTIWRSTVAARMPTSFLCQRVQVHAHQTVQLQGMPHDESLGIRVID